MNGLELKAIDLSEYDISSKTGFLSHRPPPPLQGEYFAQWERVLASLPDFIETKKLREEVDALPETEFNDSTLKTEEEWNRAYVLLSFLAQGYVWMEGQAGLVSKVPKKLAVPWVGVSEHLGLKPVGTYASSVLYNYSLRDPAGPVDMDNLHTLCRFTTTKDESWFFLVHVCVEMAAVSGLNAMACIFQNIADENLAAISECLRDVSSSLKDMQKQMNRMYDGCDPKVFFVILRPFLAGFKDLDAFPKGITYEGVDSKPREYYGASAGQSSSVYAFDMFLGTKHSGQKQHEFVMAMRDYMPRGHREFLTKLESMPSVREFCKNSGDAEVIASYNGAVESLASFRNHHIVLVTRYVVNQVKHSVNPTLDKKGTGGTEFSFLKKVRDDTEALKIPSP